MYRRYKDPLAVKWYGFDGTLFLNEDEVFTDVQTVDPVGLQVDQKTVIMDGKGIVARVQGGTLHEEYFLPFIFQTNEGQTDKKTLIIIMEDQ
jgi:hypothetical protein